MPDPVTPDGIISLAWDGCADWLSNSATVQAFLGHAGNAALTKDAIFLVGPDIVAGESGARPRVVILEFRGARSVHNGFASGVFQVAIERDIPGPIAPQAFRKNRDVFLEFTNIVGNVIAELADAAQPGTAGTALTGGRDIEYPFVGRSRTDEAGQYGYMQAVLSLPWGFPPGDH